MDDVGSGNKQEGVKPREPLRQLIRAWRLRCPRCGQSKLFAGLARMHPDCKNCGLDFHREPGFYLGAIYFNYGLTSVIATIGFMALRFGMGFSANRTLQLTLAFAVIFPMIFFRHARSLWLNLDQLIDPQ